MKRRGYQPLHRLLGGCTCQSSVWQMFGQLGHHVGRTTHMYSVGKFQGNVVNIKASRRFIALTNGIVGDVGFEKGSSLTD